MILDYPNSGARKIPSRGLTRRCPPRLVDFRGLCRRRDAEARLTDERHVLRDGVGLEPNLTAGKSDGVLVAGVRDFSAQHLPIT